MVLVGIPLFTFFRPYPVNAVQDDHVLADAQQRILQIRRGNITLDFGAANAGKQVYIQQLSQAFRFGCNAFQFDQMGSDAQNQLYRDKFSALFNYATLPFYWSYYEGNQGSFPHDQYLHDLAAWLASFNATAKGHPLIWQSDCCIPEWMSALNASDQRAAALARIDEILTSFPEIDTFDLVNEMTHLPNTWLGTTAVQTWETALAEARRVRPGGEFIANEYGYGDTSNNPPNPATDPYYQFLSQVSKDGYAPSAAGIQFHTVQEWLPLQGILDTLDVYGSLKIPLHITEFIPASKGIYTSGEMPGVTTEESQADWAYRAYTILFSHPAVQAITWWDFANASGGWGAWMGQYGAYMMDMNGRTLPVYDRLYNLIHKEWNSTTTVALDASGKYQFTGFYGNYTASIDNVPVQNFSIVDTRLAAQRPWQLADLT